MLLAVGMEEFKLVYLRPKEEAPACCVNGGIFFLFKESKNSKCNLCCHLKGPNKQVRELQKVSGLLKLNTNSSH